MLNFWNKVVYELDCYQKVYVAIVVDHKKGSPGTTGAQVLYTEAGEILGTIGGGIMESRLLEDAAERLKSGVHPPQLQTLHHHPSEPQIESGLVCGGSQTLVTMVLNHDSRPVLHEVIRRLRCNEAGSLVITSSGVALEEETMERPSFLLENERENWSVCLGLLNRRRLLVVGCGHCGSALARQMDILGFHVTVIESRADLPTLGGLPERVIVVKKPYSIAGQVPEHARLTFAVVMTPSYPDDVDALASLLPEAFPFIGVMGSPSKLQKINNALLSRGFSDTDWRRITAPVGLPIESDTPEEIAVSIAAQILQITNCSNAE